MRQGTAIDVICQHSKDGAIIPIKIRILDDVGDLQTYTIKEYRDVSHKGTRTMPDGMFVTDNTFIFECRIAVLGRKQLIRLYYETNDTVWRMTY